MSKILIIEDDKTKIDKLKALLSNQDLVIKESFREGVLELKSSFRDFDVLILDMTIPLWEKGNNDLGGNVEQFGGEKVLKEMKRRKLLVPTILFTMFDVFPVNGEMLTFQQIDNRYKEEFSDFYTGGIFYSSN